MKRQSILTLTSATILVSFILQGCTKAYEYAEQHQDEIGKFCQVDTITIGPPGSSEQIHITYNAAGNPVSMLCVNFEPNMNFYLRYDKHDRLTDFMLTPVGLDEVLFWETFSYPSKSVVVGSSYETDGHLSDPNPPSFSILEGVANYDLDEKGRITRIVSFFGNSTQPGDTTNAVYDQRGNIVRPYVVYDDKINVYRTNKVWQFLYQDYSNNNPIIPAIYPPFSSNIGEKIITGYDIWGLPLQFLSLSPTGTASSSFIDVLFGHVYNYLEISYSCDKRKQPATNP